MLAFECFWKLNNIANYDFFTVRVDSRGPTGAAYTAHTARADYRPHNATGIATHRHASPHAGH
jgi:hypothetical protein